MSSSELPKAYGPAAVERAVTERWVAADAFAAHPDGRPPERRYVVMMPLPNVTGALHLGHAMDNVMQDLLIRFRRMEGDNTLWQPGTDHAGIATQAVVEKRLFELEGKTRHDVGQEGLVERIWAWKDEYQARIVRQQRAMGCSCDFARQRFTMDAVCTRAVREAFFRLFEEGLIYQGHRLVNWDCQLETAVADDEVYYESVKGHFYHLRYPFADAQTGEPDHVIVATTRPETMLGDTAVACHPEPAQALERRIEEQAERVAQASSKDKAAAEGELKRLEARRESHLPQLLALAAMAKAGRSVRLPLTDRVIPLIADRWAKPELGSGCVKITPAHDPNDYEVWQRHRDRIDVLNILEKDGRLNAAAGPYAGQDRFAARRAVVEDLDAKGLLERVEDRVVEVGHSDRSKTPIEPFLSRQWFVRMGDVEGGVLLGRGTDRAFKASGLAQAAIDAVRPSARKDARLTFHPERYERQYSAWLSVKRDWCISRQLWWGHRIPVWKLACSAEAELERVKAQLAVDDERAVSLVNAEGERGSLAHPPALTFPMQVLVCLRSEATDQRYAAPLEALGFSRDADVLDTWFSSALWPFSTLGWPDPESAPVDPGQTPLGRRGATESSLDYYYPGSCLVTSRDIITLWVARMVVMGLYHHGKVPFTDCFVHAKILDGKGVTMSKSRGNGVDPTDIIGRYGADAMRYVICELETGMQDVRLPVQADCPHCGNTVELSEASHGQTIFTWLCTHCGEEFDVLGSVEGVPSTTVYSDRFDVGRSFCNKLWNAGRLALLSLEAAGSAPEGGFVPVDPNTLRAEDRWILSRLHRATESVRSHLLAYRPAAAIHAAREFFWGELCDWYLELIKPRLAEQAHRRVASQVLAAVFDQTLRLLHPFVPFITEALFEQLRARMPERGLESPFATESLLATSPWASLDARWADDRVEREFTHLRQLVSSLRELRARHGVPPRARLPGAAKVRGDLLRVATMHRGLILHSAGLSSLDVSEDAAPPARAASAVLNEGELYLGDVLDPEKERARLEKQRDKVQKRVDAAQKKLSNQGFVERAPQTVVEAERARLADMELELEQISGRLLSL